MAETTNGRKRRKRTSTKIRKRRRRPAAEAKASPIVKRIDDLVAENASLRAANAELKTENTELKGLVGQIEKSLGPTGRRRARVAATAIRSSIVRQKPRAAKKRARITNPGTVEKRRAALVKAREALALKRAAKRSAA